MIRNLTPTHALLIFLALIIGTISVAPTVIAQLALGHVYQGVQFQYLDDEDIYRARIQEILDGHGAVASPYLLEYKNVGTPPVAPVNEWVYAAPAYLFGLSFVVLASKFLLPALLFLLVYACTRKLLSQQQDASLAAIAAGLLVVLGYDFVDYRHVFGTLRGTAEPLLLIWTRTVNPIVGALEVFAAIMLAWMVTEKRRFAIIPLGCVIALSFAYFFSYGVILAVFGSLFLACILHKDFSAARDLLLAGAVSLLLDGPYWYQALTTVSGQAGKALALHNGMFYTHAPVFNKFLVVTTLLAATSYAFAWAKRYAQSQQRAWSLVATLLVGSWIAFNQQVLTGREIWVPHFVQYVIPLCYVVLVSATYLALRPAWPRAWRAAMLLVCAASLLYGVNSIRAVIPKMQDFTRLQSDAQVFTFLNRAPKDCVAFVLGSDNSLGRLIPAYTHCDVYDTTYTFFGIPQDRIMHNFLLQLRLADVAPENARAYMLTHESVVRAYFFSDWTQLFGKGQDLWLLTKIDTIDHAYQSFAKGDLKAQIQQYQMDYLITDAPFSYRQRAQLPGLTLATSTGSYFLYTF